MRKSLPTLVVLLLVLGACSSSGGESTDEKGAAFELPERSPVPTTIVTTSPVAEEITTEELLELLDAHSGTGFACDLGSVRLAHFNGGDSWLLSATDEEGHGLEILTVDMVSYARFSGELDADASRARRAAVVGKLQGDWGSWGVPDTIMLEELPVSPSRCLEWVGLGASNIKQAARHKDGVISFAVTMDVADRQTVPAAGRFGRAAQGVEFAVIAADGTRIISVFPKGVPSGFTGLEAAAGGLSAPDATAITQAEYEALVGG